MAQLICPFPGNPCLDPGDPILNISSEVEDSNSWISSFRGSFGQAGGDTFVNPEYTVWPRPTDWDNFCHQFPELCIDPCQTDWRLCIDPGTTGFEPPPLGSFWIAEACGEYYVSLISQEDANHWAQLASAECEPDIFPPTGLDENGNPNTTPRTVYANRAMTCSAPCPGGEKFYYTVRAGYYKAADQVTADRMAYSLACQLAIKNRFCQGPISVSYCCVGEPFGAIISINPAGGNFTWEIVDGALPVGLAQSESSPDQFLIDGTPGVAGSYDFTLKATKSNGLAVNRSFTLNCYGIQNAATLPEYTVGVPYSTTLIAEGPVTSGVKWTVVSGSLPAGLSLDENTGVISGTPT